MDNFEYNYELLKSTREDKKISAQSIAADLCLAERQIRSIEANSNQSFPSASLKFVAVKKYARALGLELKEVINDLEKASKCLNYSLTKLLCHMFHPNITLLRITSITLMSIGMIF